MLVGMSQEKSNRNSIPWYFPPKNPPADIASSYQKDLRDYFIPLEQRSTVDLSSIQNGSSENVQQETSVSIPDSQCAVNKNSEVRISEETVDLTIGGHGNALDEGDVTDYISETEASTDLSKRKIIESTEISDEESLANAHEPESSPSSKKQRCENVQSFEQMNITHSVNVMPARRHKTKAFYKQVLPVEPEDLTVKQGPAYHHCSKGIKKYFVSKATAGLRSPRRAVSNAVETAQKTEKHGRDAESFGQSQRITPLKKRKSNVIVDGDSVDDVHNVYGFVDENMAIEARTTRLGKKLYVNKNENASLSKKSRSKRSSPRSKSFNVNKSSGRAAKSNLRSRARTYISVAEFDESYDGKTPALHAKAYSLRARNCSLSAASETNPRCDNVRRSSRLTTSLRSPPPPLLHISQESQDSLQDSPDCTEASRALDSLYVTEVVDADSLGSPIRLKFRRVGQKAVQSSDDMPELTDATEVADVSCVLEPLPPPPLLPLLMHKRKHSKKKVIMSILHTLLFYLVPFSSLLYFFFNIILKQKQDM